MSGQSMVPKRFFAAAMVLAILIQTAGGVTSLRTPIIIRVAVGGDDGALQPGRPFATLGHALDVVADLRARRDAVPITIAIGPGTFRIDHSVRIGPEHGGSAEALLVITGAPGGATRLVGSVVIEPMPAVPDAAILARLPAEARRHVRLYRLPAAALADRRIQGLRTLQRSPVPVALEIFDEEGTLVPAPLAQPGLGDDLGRHGRIDRFCVLDR